VDHSQFDDWDEALESSENIKRSSVNWLPMLTLAELKSQEGWIIKTSEDRFGTWSRFCHLYAYDYSTIQIKPSWKDKAMQPTLQSILYIFRDPATSAIITLIGTLVGIPFTIWNTMRTTKTNELPIHTHIRIVQRSRPRRHRKNNKKPRPTVRNNRVAKHAR